MVIVAVVLFWLHQQVPLPSGEGFNVVLISIDTTRADHLGCYGHPTIQTPHIDRLAMEGTTFTECTTPVPITLPAHSSMMTGTYPFVHRVRDNGAFILHEDNETLAEALSAAGYITAGVVGAAVLNREYGINQGFDDYGDMYSAKGTVPQAGEFPSTRRADEVIDNAIAWLGAKASRKFFLFVHLFDPHYPYEAPEPFAGKYADPYVAEIAYADAQIGRLLRALKEMGLDRRTLIVLTADHGEGRGDHDEETHGCFVYDTTLSVPLILWCPERIPANRRITTQTRIIDIPPTILSFVRVPSPQAVQGASLLPLIHEGADDPDMPAYAESMYPTYNYGYSHLLALRTGGWKYIHAPSPELYHVSIDPEERQNLAETQPDRVASFRGRLRTLLSGSPVVVGAKDAQVELTQRAVEALRSLGYVGGTGANPAAKSDDPTTLLELSGPDPKDHTEEIRLTGQALHLFEARDFPAVEKILRELIERFPESQESFTWAHNRLGLALVAQGKDYGEAIVSYRKSLEIQPEDAATLTNLGVALVKNGDIAEAIEAYESALRIEPDLAQTHFNLALALRSLGKSEEADDHLQRAAELAPQKFRAYLDSM